MSHQSVPVGLDQGIPRSPDPADLGAVRRWLEPDGTRARLRPIGMQSVCISDDAISSLPDVVRAVAAPGPTVVLTDATFMRRGAADLKQLVVDLLGGAGGVKHVVIGADRPQLHADERALAEADLAVAGAGCVVSVGSGTITDIAKDATHRAGDVPLVVVQTAVSVNAFSDDMAVLLRHGVKRTVPSRWPTALMVDLPVIAGAPPDMNRAGFGELASMFTAPADWYLAGAIGMDDSWEPAVVSLFRSEGEAFLVAAESVRDHEPAGLALLARLMTLSGIALGVAATTAPMSGTEHIVSHLLDMEAEHAGRPLNFHGAQVGVAAIVAALAWRQTLDTFDPLAVDVDAAYPDPAAEHERVRVMLDRLDSGGAVAEECWRDVERKLARWSSARPRFEAFLREGPRHRDILQSLVADPGRLARALGRAGAPVSFSDLDSAVSPGLAHWAVATVPLMRERFVLAALRRFTGSWSDADIDQLMASAYTIGEGQ